MSEPLAARVHAFWDETREHLEECIRHCFATRAREVLDERRGGLQGYGERCLELKEEAVGAGDEDCANALLSVEFMLNAVFNNLSMWISLKDDQAHKAWECLVVAQGAVRCAMKAHRIGESMRDFSVWLHRVEQIVFPPQLFVSSAFTVSHYDCSVCGQEYGTCGHLVGRPYMGELCSRVPQDIKEIRHVAIMVDSDPMDKRCRVMTKMAGGKERDALTWRVATDEDTGEECEQPDDGHLRLRCSLMHASQEPGI